MFKRMGGGGVKGFLNNVKKNCTFLAGWLPLLGNIEIFLKFPFFDKLPVVFAVVTGTMVVCVSAPI